MSNISPKEKISKKRRNTRRAANYGLDVPAMVKCPKCKAFKLAHQACPSCGYYKDEVSVDVKKDKKEDK